jgi:hypothetical protein
MESRRRFLALTVSLVLAAAGSARADQAYNVSGNDSYQVGSDTGATNISYVGTQELETHGGRGDRRFVAIATYTRTDQATQVRLRARFVQEMEADGSLDDRSDQDPDFLTILNQPFAIQLDARTMRDLRDLRGSVPFEATSPLGGARLTGTLRPALAGIVDGVPVTGVRFSAQGPMTGTLPEHSDAQLEGTIRMNGTAYYADHQALLLALDATLTIEGTLHDKDVDMPVHIVYHRVIKAGPVPHNPIQ